MWQRFRPLLVVAAILLPACQSDPVTGKPYYSPLANDYKSQDEFIRRNFVTQMRVAQEGGLIPEREINEACRDIFAQVITGIPDEHRREFDYFFYLAASPQVNAYTYGGGRVHAYLGLVSECEDSAEFAGVIAHEIGHISHDHIGQEMGRSAVKGSLFGWGALFGETGRQITEGIGNTLTQFSAPSYSRRQESEADERAVDYTIAAGIDPDGLARFFERHEADAGGLFAQLRQTHPSPKDRVLTIRERIAEETAAEKANAKEAEDPVRAEERFAKARDRARIIVPFYADMDKALATQKPEEIVAAADRAIVVLPHHGFFHLWRGIGMENLEKRDEALASLREAAQLDRTNFMVPLFLCLLEYDSKNYLQAERAAESTIAVLPTMAAAYLIHGFSLYKLDRKEDAMRDFDLLVYSARSGRDRAKVVETIRSEAPDYEFDEERAKKSFGR